MSFLPRTGRHQPLKMLVEHDVVILIEIACSRDPTPVKHFPGGLGSGKEKTDLCTRDTVAKSNLALNADRRGLWLLCQSQQRVDVCSNLISTCFLPIGQLFAQQFLFLQSDSGIFLMYIVSYTWNSHSLSFYLFFSIVRFLTTWSSWKHQWTWALSEKSWTAGNTRMSRVLWQMFDLCLRTAINTTWYANLPTILA